MSNFFTARKGLTEAIASTFRNNYPTFFPNLPFFQELAVGDFGIYEDGTFIKKGNLADFKVPYTCSPQQELHTFFNCSSTNTSCQETGGQASSGIIPVKPSLSIKLERENAYFCCGVFAGQISLSNPKAIEKHINTLTALNEWDKNHCIISSVYTARNFVFMATAGKAVQAVAELSYSPAIPSPADDILSQAAVQYKITRKTNIGHIICTGADTPQVVVCMQMLKLKRGNLSNYKGLNSTTNETVALDEEGQDYILSIIEE
jgi:hypothetical protein